MTHFFGSARRFGAWVVVGAALGHPALCNPAWAHDFASPDGTLKITGTWTRATPAGARVAVGYFTITNSGTAADRLIGGTLVTAKTAQVHVMEMAGGVMTMHQLETGLEIPAGGSVDFRPVGYHMMFIGLTAPVKEGDRVEGTLVFQRAGTVPIHYHAAALGAATGPAMEQRDHGAAAKP